MVLSSDADNADSFNDYVAVLDEIHQAKTTKCTESLEQDKVHGMNR